MEQQVELKILALATNPENWAKTRSEAVLKELSSIGISKNIINRLIARRHLPENIGFERCYKKIGRTGFININLFTLWMSGLLPEQQVKPLVKDDSCIPKETEHHEK